MLTLGRCFGEKAFIIQESADKSLQKITYTTKSDAVTVTDGADDHLVTAKVSRYDTADQIIVYVEGTDIDGLSQNDTVTFRISDGTNECSVVLTVKKATIGTEVSHGQNFVWKMSKTSDGYTALIIFDKALLGENVGDVLVETTLHNAIVSTDASLGNSPVGDVAQKGDWLLLDGKLENDGRSWTFFRGVSGTKYMVESTITLLDNGTVARPGVIVAQTEDWIIAFALQLNAPDRDWVGLIRISTQDPTVWEYMNGENGTMCNSFVSSPSYGVRTDSGCKMTAVRDGNNLYLLINDELITMVQECNWLGATETAACGLFNEDCTARYTGYRVVTDGEEVDILLSNVLSQGIIETNGEWTEEAGVYQNSDKVTNSGGYKVIQTIDGTKYVVSATITLSEAITDGARPGIVIAGNKQYVLAFAYCGNNIGFSMRPSWEGSLYNVNAALTDGRTVTLTVVRDGQTFYGFVDGVLANQFTCDKVNADADGVFGFFNWGSDATYSNYSVDTTEATYNTWMAKLDTENKIEMGTWTESDGAYSCSDGFKVMDLVDTDEYVVSAEISLSAALSGGARPGLVVAGNDQYVLAVAFCDGWIGLAKRTLSNEWDIPAGYVENAILATGESPTCTLTVLRQGQNFHVFINGTYIASYSYNVMNNDCSTGLFNIGCDATFASYSVDKTTDTVAVWAAKLPS